jgi:hypothetical protein
MDQYGPAHSSAAAVMLIRRPTATKPRNGSIIDAMANKEFDMRLPQVGAAVIPDMVACLNWTIFIFLTYK